MRQFQLFAALALMLWAATALAAQREPIVLSNDGGWCWFEDPRTIVWDGKLIVGTVANGRFDPERKGDIEAIVHDLASGQTSIVELHDRLQADDHNSPVFLLRPDNRLLTIYSKHNPESFFHYRISEPGDPLAWGPNLTHEPTTRTQVSYSNPHMLSAENNRIYNFFRGLDASFKPSVVWSDDLGQSWQGGHIIIDVPSQFRHRPYMRYTSNGRDAIHMIYTEGHPRDYDNSIYHIFYRDGMLNSSDGKPIREFTQGLERPEQGTLIYQGGPDNVAWSTEIRLDEKECPYIAFSVQMNSAGLPRGQGGDDHRYFYARWDGELWDVHQMAYAGTRLYPKEDDYTGLLALDPHDPNVVYISTDADPASGAPLISAADGKRHYEIFRGQTQDRGASWTWTPITRDSDRDNLRPMVPEGEPGRTILLWLRGEYRTYTDYDLDVVALID